MNWADYAILAIIALSAIVGLFRGFLREVIGLATWVAAFYVAFISAEMVAPWFQQWIASDSIRIGVAFSAIFIAVLVAGGIVTWILGKLADNTGLAGTDRVAGAAFGVVRGAGILVLLVLLAGMTPLPRDGWWRESVFIDHLRDGAMYVRDQLPERFAQAIVFPVEQADAAQPAAEQPPTQVINLPTDKPPAPHSTN